MAQHVDAGVGHGHAEVLVDDLRARDGGDVLEDALAAIAEAGSLDGDAVERAAQLVQQDGGQRFALDVLGNDEQRTTGLHDLLQQGHHVLDVGDLLVGEEDVGIAEDGLHLLHVGGHVRRDVAALVLHALDDVHVDAERLALLDGDGAVLAHGIHGLGDLLADLGVAGGNGADVRDLLLGGDGGGVGLDGLDHGVGGLLDAATDAQGIGAGGHVAQALGHDDVSQQRGRRGAVAGDVVRLHGHFANQLGAHVLDGVLELDFLGHGYAVVRDQRSTVGFLQRHVTALGPERHLDGVGQLVDAGSKRAARVGFELNLFSHIAHILST